ELIEDAHVHDLRVGAVRHAGHTNAVVALGGHEARCGGAVRVGIVGSDVAIRGGHHEVLPRHHLPLYVFVKRVEAVVNDGDDDAVVALGLQMGPGAGGGN